MDWLKENWIIIGMAISCASMHLLCFGGRKKERVYIESPTGQKFTAKPRKRAGKGGLKVGAARKRYISSGRQS